MMTKKDVEEFIKRKEKVYDQLRSDLIHRVGNEGGLNISERERVIDEILNAKEYYNFIVEPIKYNIRDGLRKRFLGIPIDDNTPDMIKEFLFNHGFRERKDFHVSDFQMEGDMYGFVGWYNLTMEFKIWNKMIAVDFSIGR